MFSDSALVSAVFAPFEFATRPSNRGVPSLLVLRFYGTKVKFTGLGIFSAIARGTERRLKGGTSSGTTGAVAAQYVLGRVVRVTTGNASGLVGVCEDKVEEQS